MIKIENLKVRYGKEYALDGVSLNFQKGKSYGIIGESGCGKTTLLYLISGLIKEFEGDVSVNGETSLILQNLGLFNWFTVEKNIELGIKEKLTKEDMKKKVNEVLTNLSLETQRKKYPKELSGGQKQRVAIGRTLISNPEILLLDEATSSLDSINKENIQDLLLDIKKSSKNTMIFVTHNIEEAVFLGEEIIVMKKGKVHKIISNPYFGDKDIRRKTEYFNICNKVRGELYE